MPSVHHLQDHFWSAVSSFEFYQHERDIDILEQVQQRPQRLSRSLCLYEVFPWYSCNALKLCFSL